MRIGRTLPPTAAPIPWNNIFRALFSIFSSSSFPVKNFENELREYFGVKYCFLVSSGKAALFLILKALHEVYPDNDEVLIPSFTCFSVPAAITKAGLKIKLCDLDIKTFDFERKNLQKIVNTRKNTILCVIPAHLFGIPVDIEATRKILGTGIPIIEDAAQAMGNEVTGKKLGTLGDVGFFSLGRGKALSTIEGGIIITNRDDVGNILKNMTSTLEEYSITAKLRLLLKSFLTNLFQHPALFWFPKSLPFLHLGETIYEPNFEIKKISNVHCILAKGWENRLNKYQNVRMRNCQYFYKNVKDFTSSYCLKWFEKGQPLLRIPFLIENTEIRDEIIKKSLDNGLGIMLSYPFPINEIPDLTHNFTNNKFPVAKLFSDKLVTIPSHGFVTQKDLNKISTHLRQKNN